MFLGSVIYDKRRSLNLTQSDLSSGICTQNTISKMEKHNLTPQIDVLIKICRRLDLTLNEVFSDFASDTKVEQGYVLNGIERDVLLNNFTEVEERLSLVSKDVPKREMKRLNFIHSVVFYADNNFEKATFELDKVLQNTRSDNDDIYTLLSYLYKAKIYNDQKHLDMAAYYVKNIEDSLQESFNIANANTVQILFMSNQLVSLLIKLDQPQNALKLAKRALEYANQNYASYFIDSLNYYAALASTDKKQKLRFQTNAQACADMFGNKSLQAKIAQIGD